MPDAVPAKQIAKILTDTAALIEKLQEERWADYDLTLQKAIVMVLRPGFAAFQRAAKSISRVRPEETIAQPVGGEPWFGSVLDEMR